MTDEELITRLRSACFLAFDDGTNDYGTAPDAADRIEALVKQCEGLAQAAMNNGQALILAEARIRELEARPASAVRDDAMDEAEVAEIERSGKRWHGEAPQVYRWEPYKPDGQRQMKAKGRWQRQVGSGEYWRWENCERPSAIRALKGGAK